MFLFALIATVFALGCYMKDPNVMYCKNDHCLVCYTDVYLDDYLDDHSDPIAGWQCDVNFFNTTYCVCFGKRGWELDISLMSCDRVSDACPI